MVRNLWNRIAARSGYRISHVVHPGFTAHSWAGPTNDASLHFLRDDARMELPKPDLPFLASLERPGVPTIHNMLLGDRHISRFAYEEGLAYATYIARRLITLFGELKPSVVIGDFDGVHASMGLAVARHLGIPWYTLQFTSMPVGRASFCTNLSPASAVVFEPERMQSLRPDAEEVLTRFELGRVRAAAYIPPQLDSPTVWLKQIPAQLRSLVRVAKRQRHREFLRFTDYENSYSVAAQFRAAFKVRRNALALRHAHLRTTVPKGRYAFFGLHMQPESSIDVMAHFYSNQLQVIEMISRSLPPTHRLMVKLHKSDAPNYSPERLAKLAAFPGVELVSPYADSIEFIRNAKLVFSIQGTIGLEAALLAKPVILFGDSPTRAFPSASTIGRSSDLPDLVHQKLNESRPDRAAVIDAFARYLSPYYPASLNDWGLVPSDSEIDGYVHLFGLLRNKVLRDASGNSFSPTGQPSLRAEAYTGGAP